MRPEKVRGDTLRDMAVGGIFSIGATTLFPTKGMETITQQTDALASRFTPGFGNFARLIGGSMEGTYNSRMILSQASIIAAAIFGSSELN